MLLQCATPDFEGPKGEGVVKTQGSSDIDEIAEEAGNDYSDDDDDNDEPTVKNTTKNNNEMKINQTNMQGQLTKKEEVARNKFKIRFIKEQIYQKTGHYPLIKHHYQSIKHQTVKETGHDYSDDDNDQPAVKTTTKYDNKLENNKTDMQGPKANKEEVSGGKGDDYLFGLIHHLKDKLIQKPVHHQAPVVNVHQSVNHHSGGGGGGGGGDQTAKEAGHDYSDNDDDDDKPAVKTKNNNEIQNSKTDMQGHTTNKKEISGEKGKDYFLGGIIKKVVGGIFHHKPAHHAAPVVNVHQEVGHDYSDNDDDITATQTNAEYENEMANNKTDVQGQKTKNKEISGRKGDDYFFWKHKHAHHPKHVEKLCSVTNWRPGCAVCSNCNTPVH